MRHCWTTRHEAMGFEHWSDAIVDVGREELQKLWRLTRRNADLTAYDRRLFDLSADPWDSLDPLRDVCLLPVGHDEDHDFTPESEIVFRFR